MSVKRFCAATLSSLVLVAGEDGVAAEPVRPGGDAEAALQLDSVIVSVRRREEKLQEVPAPVAVVDGETLEAQGIYQVQDLPQVLPGMSSQFLHARQSSVAVRGIGNNVANEGLEGSVGLYLDNVFLGRPGQMVFDLIDISQVELARGPQGTLFGKNTTAGVLSVTTREPAFDREGTVEGSLGNRGYRQFKGTVSGPVSDTVAYRLSAYDTHDDGWVRNLYDNRTLDEINRRGVRGQLLIKPDADFRLRLILEHHDEDSSTGTLVPYGVGPLTRAGVATSYVAISRALGAQNFVVDPAKYQVSIDGPQNMKVAQNGLSAQGDWQFGGYRLTSITAWRDWNFDPQNDIDQTSLNGSVGGFTSRERQFSQELRLASPAGARYDYVVGGYYYEQQVSSQNRYDTGPFATAQSGGAFPSSVVLSGRGESRTDSLALFGQGTWHLTTVVDLGAGLRYTAEDKQGRVVQNSVPGLPAPFIPVPLFNAWDSGNLHRHDDSLAGQLNAAYRFNRDLLVYALWSRGEKSGGFNLNSVASIGSALGAPAITLKPEKANNLELGLKGAWFERKLQGSVNLFVTKVSDYQAVTATQVGGTYLAQFANVGDVTSKGLEFDLKAAPTSRLLLNLNGAYTLARFDSGTAPTPFEVFNVSAVPTLQGYGRGVRSIAGNWVNGAPRWTVNTGMQYRRPQVDGTEHYVNGAISLRSESYGDINNSVYSRIPGYGLANVAAGWRVPQGEGRWDVSVWVRNLFDKRYYLGLTSPGSNVYVASVGQPRTLGTTLRYDF